MRNIQHLPKADNQFRALCGRPRIDYGTAAHRDCQSCTDIAARDERQHQSAIEALCKTALRAWQEDGKPRCVDTDNMAVVPAKFNCATDGPRLVQVCAACYAIDENGQRVVPNDTPTAERKTNAATYIECTKSEFEARLQAAFADAWDAMRPADHAEFQEVIDGLVTQAAQPRGTFSGYNAYLDLEFTVTPDMLDRSPAEIREAMVDQFGGRTCCDSNEGQFHEDGCPTIPVEADEYQPSAAITAMIAFVKTQPGYTTEQGYAVFRGIVVAVRTERPDWSDVQARDWLRAQIDS